MGTAGLPVGLHYRVENELLRLIASLKGKARKGVMGGRPFDGKNRIGGLKT